MWAALWCHTPHLLILHYYQTHTVTPSHCAFSVIFSFCCILLCVRNFGTRRYTNHHLRTVC